VSVPPAWNRLTDGDPSRIILCSDFTATGRTVATFTDLAQVTGLTPTWYETAPPDQGAEAGMATDDYVRRWVDQLPGADAEVVVVAGFCVGAVFAAPIYQAVCTRQAVPPLLLLFDPEQPSPQLLLRHFRELLLNMRQYLDEGELASVHRYCEQAPVDRAGMPELADWLSDRFAEIATGALVRIGLDAEHSGQIAATFRSFISYLAAAAGVAPVPTWQQGVAISSMDEHSGLNPLPPAERGAAVGSEHRFPLHHTTLLSDSSVSELVTRLVRDALPAGADR